MNLHAIANPVISAVNPNEFVTVQVSTGYMTAGDGTQIPQYAAPQQNVLAQVQALSFGDIQHLDGLNIQGERRAIYLYGFVDGLVRPDNKGGDLITRNDGSIWLVAQVLEYWGPPDAPQWCKVAATLQNGA